MVTATKHALLALLALLLAQATLYSDDLTPSELTLKRLLGDGTPAPIPLWPGKPPKFLEDAPAETVDEHGRIRMISVPTISPYLPPEGRSTGMAIIVCPGGGYGSMDWKTHVVYAASVFNAKGIAVIGLKYRTRPPHMVDNAGIQKIALLDAERAVRLTRHRAAEWNLHPHKIGVAGYSAGANLAMNLAANFTAGDANAAAPIERESSRPDFVVGLATWHWRKKESPFTFGKETPPVFLVHATNDGINGGAPIELPYAIKADLERLGVPVHMEVFDRGAHGVGNLIPQRVKHGFPPAKWPDLLLKWLEDSGRPAAPAGTAKHDWALGPFIKRKTPVLTPNPEATFLCPVSDKVVKWEEQNVYNPAAIVRHDKVHLLYRADDRVEHENWNRTCRTGLAVSDDGRQFKRTPEPVIYPDNDTCKAYEWVGGVEDIHITEDEAGTYYVY